MHGTGFDTPVARTERASVDMTLREMAEPAGCAQPARAGARPAISRRRLSVLGATGSIGASTLDLVGRQPDRFEIVALTANTNATELARLARQHAARLAVVADPTQYGALKEALAGSGIEAAAGAEALDAAAAMPSDCVVAGIVGAAGLRPTFAAVAQGGRVALANKECLVTAGPVFMAAVAAAGAELMPVDSEHCAAFQALAGADLAHVERITLTASGGPFRGWSREQLAAASPEQALRHPNWTMGQKITIDSATLMNKGLEIIEAFYLFPVGLERLEVVVHPQSIVHCLVSFLDGSVIAQMASPDMRTPIAHALAFPGRMPAPTAPLDLVKLGALTFEAVDGTCFPAVRLAREAIARGRSAPAVYNAANEVAVAAFLGRRIGFLDIAATVATSLDRAERAGLIVEAGSLQDVIAIDAEARELAQNVISG